MKAKILKFPRLRQSYEWDCGASAIQAVLAYYNFDVREEVIIKLAKTDQQGTLPAGLKKVAKAYKLKFTAGRMDLKDIKKYLDRRTPVILLLQAWAKKEKIIWENSWRDGHYVVAIGYDFRKIYFADPYNFRPTFLNYEELDKRWHDIDRHGKKYFNWGMAVLGKPAADQLTRPVHMD